MTCNTCAAGRGLVAAVASKVRSCSAKFGKNFRDALRHKALQADCGHLGLAFMPISVEALKDACPLSPTEPKTWTMQKAASSSSSFFQEGFRWDVELRDKVQD